MRRDSKFARRQVAARRLLLNARGELTPDARVLAAYLRRLCHAAPGTRLIQAGPAGVDASATVAAAARREVWDDFVKVMNLDPYELTNLGNGEDQ
jgi:hypothetical protein